MVSLETERADPEIGDEINAAEWVEERSARLTSERRIG